MGENGRRTTSGTRADEAPLELLELDLCAHGVHRRKLHCVWGGATAVMLTARLCEVLSISANSFSWWLAFRAGEQEEADFGEVHGCGAGKVKSGSSGNALPAPVHSQPCAC